MNFKIILFALRRDHTQLVLDLRTALGLRIEEIRNSLQLSREQLASRVGIDARQVANCELYGAWPEPETVTKIAVALGVEIHDLFTFTEARKLPLIPLEKRLAGRESRSEKARPRRKRPVTRPQD